MEKSNFSSKLVPYESNQLNKDIMNTIRSNLNHDRSKASRVRIEKRIKKLEKIRRSTLMRITSFVRLIFQGKIRNPCASRCQEDLRNSAVEFIPLNGMPRIISKPALDWSCNHRPNSKLVYASAVSGIIVPLTKLLKEE